MRWVALFEDKKEGAADIRARFTEAHQAYLRANSDKIVLAGAMRPQPDGVPVGGLWVFEAETKEEVEAIIRQDPFQREGLRSVTRIYAWGTAPGFEARAEAFSALAAR
ncbi:YciI family protein [Pelagibacterium xiamenense]|uniref:YciI family protein n=1 Tax=Pelagibacterium xiamenense TaxID=2901140 RepID=UPI001E3604F9|nr:YciI family protein [Pelagibacterium xiamenense]MCD7058289.1 YciI family protein [Pelagibacterium xiamenense]